MASLSELETVGSGSDAHPMAWKKQSLLLALVLAGLWLLLFQLDLPDPQDYRALRRFHVAEDRAGNGWLVDSAACRIQDLDPFDKNVLQYLFTDKKPDCTKFYKHGRLVTADSEALYIDQELLKKPGQGEFECSYSEFWRVEVPPGFSTNYSRQVDKRYRFSTVWRKISEKTKIENEEFVQVKCTIGNETIFSDFFAFPRRDKKQLRERNPNEANILIVGVDSVSRLHLHRQMPKTVQFLKTQPLSFEMLGYNKVGPNTFANLAPILSGLTEPELVSKCMKNSVSDDCPLIWNNFKKAGFHTGFAEDCTDSGLFQYYNHGFRKQPTDYYGQIFHFVAEQNIAHTKRVSTNLCLGNRKQVEVLLEEAKNFAIRLKDDLTMGLFWSSSLTHGRFDLARYGDYDILEVMETLETEGILNTTVLIFLSDHGFRWGKIRGTYQGYLEERLPFLFFCFPEWFQNKFPLVIQNLKANTRRLTTPFDLHETLLDLTDLKNLETSMIERSTGKQNYTRGVSLFLPIPENRSCEDARIPSIWCTCHSSNSINVNETIVNKLSILAVDHINQLLADFRQCSILELKKIHSARRYEMFLDKRLDQNKLKKDMQTDYTLIIETVPGNAVFEALIRHRGGKEIEQSTVLDPINRLNTYSNQSQCVSDHKMKLYCFCLP